MKKIITTLVVCLITFTWTMSQNVQDIPKCKEDVILKGDYVLINKKCTTTYKNYASLKELGEVDKVLIKRNAILSVVVYNKSIFISTSEICWMTGSNGNKNYSFDFLDSDSLEKFFSKLTETLASN